LLIEENPMDTSSKKTKNNLWIIIGIVGVLVVVLCVCLIIVAVLLFPNSTPTTQNLQPQDPTQQLQPTEALVQPVTEEVAYQIIREWEIANGGYGRVLFVDPKFRNENDLKKLGDELKELTNDDRNAFVWVYDDIKAAQMQENAMELNEADGAFYDKHFILTYKRNINTGFHQLVIMVDGFSGNAITIDY